MPVHAQPEGIWMIREVRRGLDVNALTCQGTDAPKFISCDLLPIAKRIILVGEDYSDFIVTQTDSEIAPRLVW